MEIQFTKMHGLGNDFVMIDAINQDISLNEQQVKFIANRRFGVGCDQLLLVEKSEDQTVDFRYRIYNNDGGEVEQCGNGARCFANFVHAEGLTDKNEISVITSNTRLILNRQQNGDVTVNMGAPVFTPADIPLIAENTQTSYELEIEGEKLNFSVISMGNPHAVILVDDVMATDVEKLGIAVQNDKHFPNSVNVGFMQILNRSQVKLRVY